VVHSGTEADAASAGVTAGQSATVKTALSMTASNSTPLDRSRTHGSLGRRERRAGAWVRALTDRRSDRRHTSQGAELRPANSGSKRSR
jgi:hypothetical protein